MVFALALEEGEGGDRRLAKGSSKCTSKQSIPEGLVRRRGRGKPT